MYMASDVVIHIEMGLRSWRQIYFSIFLWWKETGPHDPTAVAFHVDDCIPFQEQKSRNNLDFNEI